ncbi:hypothetical protein [Bradyrhizobium sp.]|uniref:hypothetical protein n=1 Tax=Bradyrhizobium sp. TaxID=376 RepID=UPI0039E57E36
MTKTPVIVPAGAHTQTSLARRERLSFALECAGRPILAFAAISISAAKKLCEEDWFLNELCRFQSNGSPLWDGKQALMVRAATAPEHAEVLVEHNDQFMHDEDTKYTFSFLVCVDPEKN